MSLLCINSKSSQFPETNFALPSMTQQAIHNRAPSNCSHPPSLLGEGSTRLPALLGTVLLLAGLTTAAPLRSDTQATSRSLHQQPRSAWSVCSSRQLTSLAHIDVPQKRPLDSLSPLLLDLSATSNYILHIQNRIKTKTMKPNEQKSCVGTANSSL